MNTSDVLAAANRRADALAARDADHLRELLHSEFRWTSFRGDVFDRDSYVEANTASTLVWLDQRLDEADVVIAGNTAVLTGVVIDEVERDGTAEVFRLRVTQVWVLEGENWLCLAGHAGPRL